MQEQYNAVIEQVEQDKLDKEDFKGFAFEQQPANNNPYTALMLTHAVLFPFNKSMTYFADIRFIQTF